MVVKIKVAYICPLFDDDKKGKMNNLQDCNLKILGDISWFKGKFVYLSYILASGKVRDYLVLSYQLGEDC